MFPRKENILSVEPPKKPKCPPTPRKGAQRPPQATPEKEARTALLVSIDYLEKLNTRLQTDSNVPDLKNNRDSILQECLVRVATIRTSYPASSHAFLQYVCSRLDAIVDPVGDESTTTMAVETSESSSMDETPEWTKITGASPPSAHPGFFAQCNTRPVLGVKVLTDAIDGLTLEHNSESSHQPAQAVSEKSHSPFDK